MKTVVTQAQNGSGTVNGCGLSEVNEQAEWIVPSPAIDLEIAVKRQDIAPFNYVGQANQAGIRQVNPSITILHHRLPDFTGRLRKLERDLESSSGNVLKHDLSGAPDAAQEITTLGDHGFASEKRSFQAGNYFH